MGRAVGSGHHIHVRAAMPETTDTIAAQQGKVAQQVIHPAVNMVLHIVMITACMEKLGEHD